MPIYHRETTIEASAEQLFDWHAQPGAFPRLLPPWEGTRVVQRAHSLAVGERTILDMAMLGPIRTQWVAEHTYCERPTGFDDVQREGPFTSWLHQHRFHDGRLEDRIEWVPPMGGLGVAVAGASLEARIDRGFQFRHARTKEDVERLAAGPQGLRVAVTGASGLVGTALSNFLSSGGHTVVPLVRKKEDVERLGGIFWNVREQVVDAAALEGIDAVVHLAGAGVAEGAWTDERKSVLRDSRIDGTRLLSEALAGLTDKPKVFVSGSAVGVYGDRGGDVVDATSGPGTGFLADLGQAWEATTEAAEAAGIRTVKLRTGIVLALNGGALPAMLPAFRAGTGGPIGGGQQYVPWIHLDDLVYAIHFAIGNDAVRGPINGTGPTPVPQRDFARALGRALSRPAFVPAPGAALRMIMGAEKADELVLAGQNAVPNELAAAGFRWAHPEVEGALRALLGS